MNVQDALASAVRQLKGVSTTPYLDAQLLLGHILGWTKLELIKEPQALLSSELLSRFEVLLHRRIRGEPVAYLLGKKEFFGIDFEVNESVLVPRPDTELLVNLVVERAIALRSCCSQSQTKLKLCDLGTGTGCILVSIISELLKHGIEADAVGVDESTEALAVAQRNVDKQNLSQRITLIKSDWWSNIPAASIFDIVVSNPPYIAFDDSNVSNEIKFEPPRALFAAESGLREYKRIIADLPSWLRKGGTAWFEIGSGQSTEIAKIAKAFGYDSKCYKDLAGHFRVVEVKQSEGGLEE